MDYLQYLKLVDESILSDELVLNLIINGLPSIQSKDILCSTSFNSFKPYYKWITFNTEVRLNQYIFYEE